VSYSIGANSAGKWITQASLLLKVGLLYKVLGSEWAYYRRLALLRRNIPPETQE